MSSATDSSPARQLRWAVQLSAFTTRPEEVDAALAAEISALGFTGVHCYFGLADTPEGITLEDPRDADLHAMTAAAEILRQASVEPLSTWGYWAPLVAADEGIRRDAIAQVGAAADIAVALGCPYVITGAGSNVPGHAWHPHPDNHGDAAIGRLITSLEAAVTLVAQRGVQLVLKPHVLSTIASTQIITQILNAIETPALRVGFDPINLVRLEDVYGARDLMDRCVAAAPGRLGYAHVKDFILETPAITHITEVPVGEGALDLTHFLELAAQHAHGGWVVAEHLQREQLSSVMKRLRAHAIRPSWGS